MPKNPDVLISGGSVAGLALAYWLRHHGFNPTVVERAPAPRPGGYKIDIRGAALGVVERMGILDEIRRASTDMLGSSLVDGEGKRLATMDADLFGGREGDDVEIMRGDLARILHGRIAEGVEYIFDDSVTAVTEHEDGVDVTFERSAPRTFDLVVGADGLHSNVRSLVFGDESRFIRDLGYHISIFTTPNHLGLDRWELMHPAPGKSAGMYSTRQDAQAKAMFIFASGALDHDHRDVARQKKILAETFAGGAWEVSRLLDSMWDAPDFYFDSISQIHMDRWSSGRTVLVGDAGYGPSPASGQGTSLALVGAYVLAGELAAAAGDHRTAFARYEEEMRDFVTQNQKLAQTNIKGMVVTSKAQIWIQTRMLRLLPHLPTSWSDRVIGRITETIRKAATAITLKDYRP
jgi:2-polyprenyl-6-methoxyphenol hydroxylase-like FAD-dependent oxidoreductase